MLLLWESVTQTPEVRENPSAAFLLLDGAAEDVPRLQENQRERKSWEKEERNRRAGPKAWVTTIRRHCPWKAVLHGTEELRQDLMWRRLLNPVSVTTMSFWHSGVMLSPAS